MSRLLYNKAKNDADYKVTTSKKVNGKTVRDWTCPYYRRWTNMLARCYCEKYTKNYPSYETKEVCEEWLSFSKFKSWMEKQDWGDKHLDKDLLVVHNKIYSPETCVFVSEDVNNFLVKPLKRGKALPLGVVHYNRKSENHYVAYIANRKKTEYLGYYPTKQLAHSAWQIAKLLRIKGLITQESDARVLIGLRRVQSKMQYEYENQLETFEY